MPSAEARELDLYIENDGDLYRSMTHPIYRNLANKRAQGIYLHSRAVVAFQHLAEAGAKKYAKEHGAPGDKWSTMFPPAARKEVAEDFARYFEIEYDHGNWDHLLTEASKKKRANAKKS